MFLPQMKVFPMLVSSELTPNLYLKPQRQKNPHLEICSSGFPARALQSMKQIRVVKWLKFSSQVLGHSTGLIPTGGCPTQKCFLLPLCSKSQREPKGSVVTTQLSRDGHHTGIVLAGAGP